MKSVCKRVGIILALLTVFLIIAPQPITFAQPNQMVNPECLQNPEACMKDSTAADKKKDAAVGLSAWDYIKMILALIFVLVLLVWVLKFINKRSFHFQQNNIVRNIGGISLGSQKSIQILQIGEKIFIVGVGENVQLIKEITDSQEIEQLMSYYNEKQTLTTTPHIAELLNKFKGQSKKIEKENDQDFGDLLNERLSDIQNTRRNELEKWKEKEHDK